MNFLPSNIRICISDYEADAYMVSAISNPYNSFAPLLASHCCLIHTCEWVEPINLLDVLGLKNKIL